MINPDYHFAISLIRTELEHIVQMLKPEFLDQIELPPSKTETPFRMTPTELADIFITVLRALGKATFKLREGDEGIILSNEPIRIQLIGNLVGIAPKANRILINLETGKKREEIKDE